MISPHNRYKPGRLIAITLLVIVALSGCDRRLGYGVLLWSEDEEAIASGSVVSVVSESEIQDNYTVRALDADLEVTLPRWRVRFFEVEEDARNAAEEYGELATVYASATRNALPMRSSTELVNDNIVYRLRSGEAIKLISRDPEPTDLSGLVSYWYLALTETGVEGYVFGYELSLFDALDPEAEFAESGTQDPLIELLLQNVWRPIYFADMISNGAYDLDLFRPEYGLFPDPDEQVLELVLPYHSTNFEYEEISKVGPRRYLAEGTDLQLTFNRGDELSLQYRYNDRQYILALQRVPGEIQDYIDAELERRSDTYEALVERGPSFSSGSYGRITLLPEQQFKWTGYERLVPAAVPEGAGAEGEVLMNLYLGPELSSEFDGALAFRFRGNAAPVNFAYALVPEGMRLLYIPAEDIEENIVTGTGVSSITLFFSASGG